MTAWLANGSINLKHHSLLDIENGVPEFDDAVLENAILEVDDAILEVRLPPQVQECLALFR